MTRRAQCWAQYADDGNDGDDNDDGGGDGNDDGDEDGGANGSDPDVSTRVGTPATPLAWSSQTASATTNTAVWRLMTVGLVRNASDCSVFRGEEREEEVGPRAESVSVETPMEARPRLLTKKATGAIFYFLAPLSPYSRCRTQRQSPPVRLSFSRLLTPVSTSSLTRRRRWI